MSPRRALLTVAVGLSLAVAGCGAGSDTPLATAPPSGPSTPDQPGDPTTTPEGSSGQDPAYVTARVTLGDRPCAVFATDTKIWVSLYGDNEVVALAPDSGAILSRTPVGQAPCGLAAGDGSIWVANYSSDDVTRIDAATAAVQETIPVGNSPYDIAYADGAAWTTDNGSGTVSRIDAATEERTTITVGRLPVGITATKGVVWATLGGGEVVRISTDRVAVTGRFRVGFDAGWTASTASMLWVTVPSDSAVVRVDPISGEVVGRIAVDGRALDGDVDGDTVWFPVKDGRILAIDAASDQVRTELPRSTGNPFVVHATRGAVWAVDFAGTDVIRIEP